MAESGGEKILGSYRLEERIGRGGMGEVWRGRHTRLGSERAVKVLPAHLAAEEDFLKRFEREASSASRLDHPNILAVYEYGESNGTPYLVMPYVKGGTLKERMARGPVPREEALDYMKQTADALDYAHEQGLVHRDVKPANLLLDGRGRLYLADFGIAKALEGAEGLTRTGVGVGTPEYMAPEQAQGRADQRSDLYALGVVLYQLLTGRVPYSGNSTVEVLMKHLQDPLPLLPLRSLAPSLPPRVEQVVTKALAKNPNDRYASGRALVEDLREALSSAPATGAEAAATIIGTPTAYPSGQTSPGGTPPHNTGAATVYGGVPAWQNPAGGTPPPLSDTGQRPTIAGGTPPPFNPSQGPMAGSFGTPPAGGFGAPPPGGPPVYSGPPGGNPPPPRRANNRGLLLGGLGALAVLLLLCVSGVAFLATRGGGEGTPTAQAGVSSTASAVAAVNIVATQTANAPTATRPASSVAPSVAPSASPSAAPSAVASVAPSAAPSVAPSASPSPSPSASPSAAPSASGIPLFPSSAPSVAPSAAPTARSSAAPSSSPTPRPSPTPSAAPSAAPVNRQPTGQAPAGWQTYRGNAKVPFALYYPPGWTVDESRASEGRIYFYGPGVDKPYDDELWVLIATTGERTPGGNIDVLRDQYYQNDIKGSHPEAGINITRNNQFSGITFASLGTNFNGGSELCYAYIGLGLNQNVPWRFRLNSLDADYDSNLDEFFSEMIGSMNIYANP
ncbi:MAG: hypothetical protein AVDCRST_MAG18-4614 [uncultured Thermomicrobiales bacterium]|uniref:non-specific serine/threonine protein kinase n=1 Tax=uncultured Thermomicrobiales bacterium TaxID=1645740 RepID=A0A6J4VY20_9BACT|nr:MAG: hypothetical protein AVDCRST_MAG18-4614 [uncultured Thermomicrobiales bacterium]